MKRAKQPDFTSSDQTEKVFKDFKTRIEHGGDIRSGKRKLSRPFDSKKSVHLTLRSSRAKGAWSFLKPANEKKVEKLVYTYAERFQIKIYRFANSGNHLHLLIKGKSRIGFKRFLRTLTGMIARTISGAKKGNRVGKFWDAPVYSKLITWGRQFKNTSQYVVKNTLETFGIIPPRKMARGHIKIDYISLWDDG